MKKPDMEWLKHYLKEMRFPLGIARRMFSKGQIKSIIKESIEKKFIDTEERSCGNCYYNYADDDCPEGLPLCSYPEYRKWKPK